MNQDVALFDLDGTLANNDHRQSYVRGVVKDWDAFFEAQADDTPNVAVVRLFTALKRDNQFDLIIVTARPERFKAVTERCEVVRQNWTAC